MFQSLIDGLKEVDPQLWYDVIDLQKHWIGEITGCTLDFKLKVTEQPRFRNLILFKFHHVCCRYEM